MAQTYSETYFNFTLWNRKPIFVWKGFGNIIAILPRRLTKICIENCKSIAQNNVTWTDQILFTNCFGEKTETPIVFLDSNVYIFAVVSALFLLMGFSTGISNLLVFIVIYKNHFVQSLPNIISTCLCISDTLTGFLLVPLTGVVGLFTRLRYLELAYKVFTVATFLTFYLITISYLTQIIVWTERYIGIFHPYF